VPAAPPTPLAEAVRAAVASLPYSEATSLLRLDADALARAAGCAADPGAAVQAVEAALRAAGGLRNTFLPGGAGWLLPREKASAALEGICAALSALRPPAPAAAVPRPLPAHLPGSEAVAAHRPAALAPVPPVSGTRPLAQLRAAPQPPPPPQPQHQSRPSPQPRPSQLPPPPVPHPHARQQPQQQPPPRAQPQPPAQPLQPPPRPRPPHGAHPPGTVDALPLAPRASLQPPQPPARASARASQSRDEQAAVPAPAAAATGGGGMLAAYAEPPRPRARTAATSAEATAPTAAAAAAARPSSPELAARRSLPLLDFSTASRGERGSGWVAGAGWAASGAGGVPTLPMAMSAGAQASERSPFNAGSSAHHHHADPESDALLFEFGPPPDCVGSAAVPMLGDELDHFS
jgi:hypothetical protein